MNDVKKKGVEPIFQSIGSTPFIRAQIHEVENLYMHKLAKKPNDLEKFFVERANAGDVDGLVALYESHALLVSDAGEQIVGTVNIREFFVDFLKNSPQLAPSIKAPALCNGDIALTSSRHSNGNISVEVARRQSDGSWRWVVDQFAAHNVA